MVVESRQIEEVNFENDLRLTESTQLTDISSLKDPQFWTSEKQWKDLPTSNDHSCLNQFSSCKMLHIQTFAQGSLSSEQPLGNPLYPIPEDRQIRLKSRKYQYTLISQTI